MVLNQKSQNQAEATEETPLYPTATKGALSDDHSAYGKQGTWKGVDPDKGNRAYLIGFIIFMMLLFAFAIQSWTGVNILGGH